MQYVIIGLGNPGEKHENTRHNAGMIILEHVRKEGGFPGWHHDGKLNALVAEGAIEGVSTMLIAPETYMNNSGKTVKKAVAKGDEERCIVVHDELDLPLGSFKISFDRGAGGHNGVLSVTTELGTNAFIRIRIGIAPTTFFSKLVNPKGSSFVLKNFSRAERAKIDALAPEVHNAISTILKEGREKAMAKFN